MSTALFFWIGLSGSLAPDAGASSSVVRFRFRSSGLLDGAVVGG